MQTLIVKADGGASDGENSGDGGVESPGPDAGGSVNVGCPSLSEGATVELAGTVSGIDVGDFDEDGNLDVVAAVDLANPQVLLGDGKGGFRVLPVTPSSGALLFAVHVADLNNDGHLDVVFSGEDAATVSVFLGDGHGNLKWTADYSPPSEATLRQVSTGDLNGDGKVDIVVASGGQTAWVALGKGDGSFEALARLSSLDSAPTVVLVKDFDGDGKVDLVSNSYVAGDAPYEWTAFNKGDGRGAFAETRDLHLDASGGLQAIDLDGDGTLDLVGLSTSAVFVDLAPVSANPKFRLLGEGSVGAVGVGDVGGRGLKDIVLTPNSYEKKVTIFPGQVGGGFGAALSFPLTGVAPNLLAAGDFNNDGRQDFVVTESAAPAFRVHLLTGECRDH